MVSCLIYYIDTAGKNALNLVNLPSLKMIRLKGAKILLPKVAKLHTYILKQLWKDLFLRKLNPVKKKFMKEKGKKFSQLCS